MKRQSKKSVDELPAPEHVPYPCPNGSGGPMCCPGMLVACGENGKPIDPQRDGASLWICSVKCGVKIVADKDARCPGDGAPVTFDPTIRGTTCGGLRLRGWNVCKHCGGTWVTRKGVPDTGGGSDGRWRLAAGGRSLDAGGLRLRPEGKSEKGEVQTLMARISRMPAFEEALQKIADGELDAKAMQALAAEALSIGDGVEEIDA